MIRALQKIGASFFNFLSATGNFTIFFGETIGVLFTPQFYFKALLRQLLDIGYYSLPIIGLTAVFTGAVLALQGYTGFSRFNAESAIASIVAISITRELGPVLGGLMLAGRVAAAIAAELGSMKVTEQIDALYTLGVNPFRYLVLPRIVAGVITMPCLVIIADIIGIAGGYLVGVYELGFTSERYISNTIDFIHLHDVTSGLIKAIVFGLIVSLIGCYCGFNSKGGAQGVGYATTNSVVLSSIMILLMNYIITSLLFIK